MVANILLVLDLIGEGLPVKDVSEVRDLLKYGEWEEAFDVLCTQLYEYEVPLTEEIFSVLEQTGTLVSADPSVWTCLRELILSSLGPYRR